MPPVQQSALSSLMSNRVLLYSAFSSAAVVGVVANAVKNHTNFYSTAVYLSKSSGAVVVLANFSLLLAVLFGRLLQHIFFGQLRTAEVERLYDRMWFFVTESLLAFTIFRDEFDTTFVVMFGALLFTKCFHWLLSDRIEWMDQRPYPGPPTSFHVRINLLMWILWLSDFLMFTLAVESMLANGVGGIVLFASEYAILLASLLNSTAKYMISVIELRRASRRGGENAPPWEDKSIYIFYVELATDFIKLVTYMTFFVLVLTFYGLPLNIIRDVYITARSFITRCRDLLRYRSATRNMDERYPNATPGEMAAMSDRTCIICREEMLVPGTSDPAHTQHVGEPGDPQPIQQPVAHSDGPNMTPKKLPCGHIFHFYCLRSWLERQQNCPTCRRTVLDSNSTGEAPQRPAARQFGANPPGNMFGLGGPEQPPQAQQRQAANLGGLLGRLAGGPAQGQLPAMPQLPLNAGVWPQQQAPVGPPQPRVFPGFYAPGGMWHPWDLDAPGDPEPHAQGQTADPLAVSSSNHVPSQRQSSMATPTSGNSTPTPTSESTTAATEPTGENSPSTNSIRPREAAAAAALRRSGPVTATSSQSTGTDKRPASSVAIRVTGTAGVRDPMLGTSSPSTASLSASISSRGNPMGSSRSNLPSLIPLYDPGLYQPHVPRPTASAQNATPAASGSGSGHIATQQTTSQSNSQHGTFVPPSARGYSPSQHPNMYPQIPQSQALSSTTRAANLLRSRAAPLPPVLTDEQLSGLDRLTRDALDERLRILENVQGLTSRCIDELMRMRSVLPTSSGPSSQPQEPLPVDSLQALSTATSVPKSSLTEDSTTMATPAEMVLTPVQLAVAEPSADEPALGPNADAMEPGS